MSEPVEPPEGAEDGPGKLQWKPKWVEKFVELFKQAASASTLFLTLVAGLGGYGLGITAAKRELRAEYDPRLVSDERTITVLKEEAGRIRLYIQDEQASADAEFTLRCQHRAGLYDPHFKTCTNYEANGEVITSRLAWLEPMDPFLIGGEGQPKDKK